MKQEFPSFYTGTYPTAKLAGKFFLSKNKIFKVISAITKANNASNKTRFQNVICLTLTLFSQFDVHCRTLTQTSCTGNIP